MTRGDGKDFMGILIVDDSKESRDLLKTFLKGAGYKDIITAASAQEAFEALGLKGEEHRHGVTFRVILLDVVMPEMNGIEACRIIREDAHLADTPVIMVTAVGEQDSLNQAFEAGATDYITKPVSKVELLARVRSVLRLYQEMERRKVREKELIETLKQLSEANRVLTQLSAQDGLTGLANRRHFDENFSAEWRRAMRDRQPLSVVMADIDHFKLYNDHYGHQGGDDCLRQVAAIIGQVVRRPGDIAARYGGEEFVLVLPDTPLEGGIKIAEEVAAAVRTLKLPHEKSPVVPYVTLSMGVACMVPDRSKEMKELIERADRALYAAKRQGRNRVKAAEDHSGIN